MEAFVWLMRQSVQHMLCFKLWLKIMVSYRTRLITSLLADVLFDLCSVTVAQSKLLHLLVTVINEN